MIDPMCDCVVLKGIIAAEKIAFKFFFTELFLETLKGEVAEAEGRNACCAINVEKRADLDQGKNSSADPGWY